MDKQDNAGLAGEQALVEDGHAEPARLASYRRLLAARNGEED